MAIDPVDAGGTSGSSGDSVTEPPEKAGSLPAIPVEIEIEHAPRVNFALHQHRLAVVQRVALTNRHDGALGPIRVAIDLANGEATPWEGLVEEIGPGQTYNLEPSGPRLEGASLAVRTERERTTLRIRAELAEALDDTEPWGPATHDADIDLLPFDHWGGLAPSAELLGAFVTPNHPAMAALLRGAREWLGRNGSDAIDGYQSGSRSRAAAIAEACFGALASRGLGYIHPPASFERAGQRVRLADRLLADGLGTCLDLGLLLAGAWEQAGLNPLVLLFEDHALPALWTSDEHFPEPAIDDVSRIRARVELGDIVPVEATTLTHADASFAGAVASATERIARAGELVAVDIRTARRLGVRPLPLRVEQDVSVIAPESVEDSATGPTHLPAVELAERAERARVAEREARSPDRVDRWRRKLLDLSLRNRLLNFRDSGRAIELLAPDIAALEDRLASGESVDLLARTDRREEDPGVQRAFRLGELEAGRVFTGQRDAETAKRLLMIYRAARSSMEETGANILYVALGMLRWREAPGAESHRSAPLILVPVTLIRRSVGGGYTYRIEQAPDPIRPNITLIEKLRADFGFDVGGLEALPTDRSGLDVPLIIRRFREATQDATSWSVDEAAWLGLFSFTKFLMWRDLRGLGERVREQPLLARLVGAGDADRADEPDFPDATGLDADVPPGSMLTTRDADSSQLVAVRAAREGRTFVLEGPPGTGKSQTIANIIADSLASGKRVLFVAEKMAALTVVRRRLQRDGLGPFCLELHSAKASKKEVLRQLGEALDASGLREPGDWTRSCEELARVRSTLNAYVAELHDLKPSGESVFDVIGRLSGLGDGARVDLGVPDPVGVDEALLRSWRARIASLVEVGAAVDPAGEHPLRGLGRGDWSFGLPEEARRALGVARASLAVLVGAVEEFGRAISGDAGDGTDDAQGLSREQVSGLARLAAHVLSRPALTRDLYESAGDAGVTDELASWIARGEQADADESALLSRYRRELFDADAIGMLDACRRALEKPTFIRWWFASGAVKRVRPYCLDRPPGLGRLVEDLEATLALASERRALAEASLASRCFGVAWRGAGSDWDALRATLDWALACRKLVDALGASAKARRLASALIERVCAGGVPEQEAQGLVGAAAAWDEDVAALDEVVCLDEGEAWGGPTEPGWLVRALAAFDRWERSLAKLNTWCAWRREREGVVDAGLGALVEAYERGEFALDETPEVFERSFGERWLVDAADASPAVRGFHARTHAAAIERFGELDIEVLRLSRLAAAGRLAERVPSGGSGSVSSGSEVGILRRELEKRSRHMPTRKLIDALPNLLPRLKPCFLMSPLSVAQYLEAECEPFDLVVFDEASQIPAWDAVGAIARGTEIVVVGDSKQLPPTSFFHTVDEGEDESDETVFGADDELESILQECNAVGVPALRLKWHYRSRHESLIAFSNHHYYDDELHTFPSPVEHSAELGASFRLVEGGVYDRGGSRTNRVEAEAVVAEVVGRLCAPGATGSIGVVTFNTQQQGLIEDLLDVARREHPEIERFFGGVDEPVFVKNLENVQGDERDTIVFSVGFGPDGAGKISMNFGPLNAEGGERRLNVAVTRARYRLVVFCSMQPEAIDLSRTRALGVRHFKRFLAYAQRGPGAMAEVGAAHASAARPSDLERAVGDALRARGWEVDHRVGMAGYRVDLGVRDPERAGVYLLGVECDGPMYRDASTARDRDRTRPSVLGGLGWRLMRVWSTAWRVDADECVREIEREIEAARAEAQNASSDAEDSHTPEHLFASNPGSDDGGEAQSPDPGAEPGREVGPEAGVVPAGEGEHPGPQRYAPATRPRGVTSRSNVYAQGTTDLVVRALVAVVDQEQPVAPEIAMRRVADWFGVTRLTEKFRDRFEEVSDVASLAGWITRKGDAFWTPEGLSGESGEVPFRVPGEDDASHRDIEWVPLVERASAVRHALRVQIAMPREDLQREAARLLGLSRTTAKTREAIDEAIDAVLRAGGAIESDGSVALAQEA